MTKPIEFFFDFSSPYGYFAAERIDNIAARHGRTAIWRPILLGAVFKVTGGQPLPSIPLKGDYAKRDLERTARLLRVPFGMPAKFPIATTAACRAFYAVHEDDAEAARRVAKALYAAYFAHNRDISAPQVVLDVAAECGLDREALGRALGDPRWKDRLRSEVESAIARGVFGSPYILVDDEPFWGADRLDQVERWLSTGGW